MEEGNIKVIDTKQLVVTQANTLIHASYKMTLHEKRLLLLLISLVKKDDKSFGCYIIPVKQIVHFLGLENAKSTYQEIRKITRLLLSRVLDIDTGNDEWMQFQWLSKSRYISKKNYKDNQAAIELQIHQELYPYLLELKKRFTSIPFESLALLPSYHSIRIFEILYDRSYQLQNNDIYIDLEELKNCLKLKDKYKNFADFKRRVLDQAQKDLEEGTPIKFTYSPVKEGRKVVALEFIVTKNADVENNQLELDLDTPRTLSFLKIDNPEEDKQPPKELQSSSKSSAQDISKLSLSKSTLLERLVDDFGIKMKQAVQLIEKYDEDYIEGNLEIVERRNQEGKVESLSAYTYQALTNDYRKQENQGNKKVKKRPSQNKIPSKHKSLISELSRMGYVGNGSELIKDIGEQGVKDTIKLAQEQEKVGKSTGKKIDNMGAFIRWIIKEKAWEQIALQRETSKKKQLKGSSEKAPKEELNPLYDLLKEGVVAKLGETTYGAWYSNIEIVSTEDTIEIHLPTRFIADYVISHHLFALEEIFSGTHINIKFNTKLVANMQ